ncbi:MAG: DUF2225 domain-containing protein [Lachnospiraceae bacterium]|nr:DUF2225 domain-containing protein [Lachnospiraceae bacterium]
MSILSGLGALGLGKIETAELYETNEAAEEEELVQEEKKPEEPKIQEADFLFDKSYNCPICDFNFKTKTVRAGKAKLLGSDTDLRPNYEGIDVIKYDTVVCPRCGYAALSRYFKFMTSVQGKLIKEGICAYYISRSYDGPIYTYDQALERYKLVLANAIVKKAKTSEKAYICLKSGWLLRGVLANLEMNSSYVKKKLTYTKEEEEYMKNAYEGFLAARSSEPFPMCGMDESTVDYLIAALAVRFNDSNVCDKLLSELLSSKSSSPRLKEKARMLKEEYERNKAKQNKK